MKRSSDEQDHNKVPQVTVLLSKVTLVTAALALMLCLWNCSCITSEVSLCCRSECMLLPDS